MMHYKALNILKKYFQSHQIRWFHLEKKMAASTLSKKMLAKFGKIVMSQNDLIHVIFKCLLMIFGSVAFKGTEICPISSE